MKSFKLVLLSLILVPFSLGCGGSEGPPQPGAVNSGAGAEAGGEEDPDAGVGTDPSLMDPNAAN